jgi:hypothetical protein
MIGFYVLKLLLKSIFKLNLIIDTIFLKFKLFGPIVDAST